MKKTDVGWKGISHCWETLVKENQKQAEILRILKPRMNLGEDTEEGEKVIWFFTICQSEHGYDTLKEWLEERE